MKIVPQAHRFGCGAACAATLARVPYSTAVQLAPHDLNMNGMTAVELSKLLAKLGIRSSARLRSLAGASPETALKGQVLLLSVDRSDDEFHWVVWDGEMVLDPQKPGRRRNARHYKIGSYLRLGDDD